MEAWIEDQIQKEQDKIIRLKIPCTSERALFFNTRRCTQSDIISIVSTIEAIETEEWGDLRINVREEEHPRGTRQLDPLLGDHVGKRKGKKRKKQLSPNQQSVLRGEEISFLNKLEARRQKRANLEIEAAKTIQTIVRGWLMRKWLKKNSGKLRMQQRMKMSYKMISRQVRLKLEFAEKAKRAEESKERASITVQSVCRMYLAKRAVRKERFIRKIERLSEAATTICTFARRSLSARTKLALRERRKMESLFRAAVCIQSVFRMWFKGRRIVASMKVSRTRFAVSKIQNAWRKYLAVKHFTLEKRREESNKKAKAAICIQSMVRGVLSRSRFGRIHSEHEGLLREAAALTIQRVFRGWLLGRRRVAFIRDCGKKIVQIWAALHIQRIIRSKLCRLRVQQIRKEKETDIFYHARIGNRQLVEDLHAVSSCVHAEDINGDTVLTLACRHGHKKIVKKCLKWGLDINHKNDFGLSGVTLAVRNGHGDIAELLISKKVEVSKFGRTLLHDACHMGLEGVVLALLANDLDPNTPDSSDLNRTCLHKAVLNISKLEVLELLIEAGHADLDRADDEGSTALHLAAQRGLSDQVAALIKAGANVSQQDLAGRTPWRVAILNDHDECASLLRAGWQPLNEDTNDEVVDPNETKRFVEIPESLIRLVAEKGDKVFLKTKAAMGEGFQIFSQDEDGVSLLMASSQMGAVETMSLCLDSFDLRDTHDQNAMHYAASSENALKVLVKAVANAAVLLLSPDKSGVTPLHLIASSGVIPEAVFRLLKREKDLVLDNVVDHGGNTPLHYAALVAAEAAVATLKDLGAQVCAKNLDGNTPLHSLASSSSVDGICAVACKQLENARDVQNREGQLPLHLAAKNGCMTLASILCSEHLDDILVEDNQGRTSLHMALASDQLKTFKMLFERAAASCGPAIKHSLFELCAKQNLKDGCKVLLESHETLVQLEDLLTLAITCGHHEIVQLFLQAQPEALTSEAQFMLAAEHGHDQVLQVMLEEWEQAHALPFQIDRTKLALLAVSSTHADNPKVLATVIQDLSTGVVRKLGFHAAASGNLKCLKYIVSLDDQAINFANEEERGRSPLHAAAMNSHVDVVSWLLTHGANQAIEDEDGATALMLAKEEVLEYFVDVEEGNP